MRCVYTVCVACIAPTLPNLGNPHVEKSSFRKSTSYHLSIPTVYINKVILTGTASQVNQLISAINLLTHSAQVDPMNGTTFSLTFEGWTFTPKDLK